MDHPDNRRVLLSEETGLSTQLDPDPEPPPPPSPSTLKKFWLTWTGLLFSPAGFFRRTGPQTAILPAFIFAIAMNMIGSVLSFPASLARMKDTVRFLQEGSQLPQFDMLRSLMDTAGARAWLDHWPWIYHGGGIVLAPITVPLFYYSIALCFIHPAARLLGGKAALRPTIIALSYTAATQPLLALTAIPMAGYLFYACYTAVLMVVALRETQGISTGRSVAALFLGGIVAPIVLFGILPALLILMILRSTGSTGLPAF